MAECSTSRDRWEKEAERFKQGQWYERSKTFEETSRRASPGGSE